MKNKETLKIEFIQDDGYIHLALSDNFNTDNPLFEELAFYLGGLEYHHQKDSASIHLTTLEKLEILCKKAREYADEESEFSGNYEEVKILVANDRCYLDDKLPSAKGYDEVELLDNNLLKVKLDNKFGVVDLTGKEILPILYDELFMLSSGIIQGSNNGIITIFSVAEAKLITDVDDVVESDVLSSQQNYFWLKKNKKWGLFDHKLNQIIPFRLEYDSCELLSDNTKENIYIKVYKDGKCGLLDGLLNIEVLPLDKDIQNIVVNSKKKFLVKKTSQDIEINPLHLAWVEDLLKGQN